MITGRAQKPTRGRAEPVVWIISFGLVGSRSDGYLVRVESTARALLALGYQVNILEVSRRRAPSSLTLGVAVWPSAPKIAPPPRLLGRLDWLAELRTQASLWTGLIRNWRKLRNSNAVVVEGGLLAGALLVRLFRRNEYGPKTIFDSISVMSELHRHGVTGTPYGTRCNVGCKIRRSVWRVVERLCVAAADVTVVVGPHDLSAFGCAQAEVVPHGILVDRSAPASSMEEPGLIGFIGSGRFASNRDAMDFLASSVLPAIQMESARCLVVGDASGYGSYNEQRVEFAGYKDSLSAVLAPVSVMCAPMCQSGGVSTKVLASLINGKRTVATPEAARGIAVPPAGFWVAERPDFAATVAVALKTPWSAERAAVMRESVQRNHGIEALIRAWGKVLSVPDDRPVSAK